MRLRTVSEDLLVAFQLLDLADVNVFGPRQFEDWSICC